MQLLIAGDLVPTKSNAELFSSADVRALLGDELLSLWNSADKKIFNLEVPLTDKESPIVKWGPNLIAPASTSKGIIALAPSLVAMANNHILDQGERGLDSTTDILDRSGIPYTGAGKNLSEARRPCILEHDGMKIGIYACAENEFSIADERNPGANPFDPLESPDQIQELKEECDFVIVLYHGGKEHYRYPSPNLQKACRKMVEKGADLIVCQHSHCIGCYEEYDGSTIVYGQGNFIFDDSDSEFWDTSLIIKADIGKELKVGCIPLVKKGSGVRLAQGDKAEEILSSFQNRSDEILQEGFVQRRYEQFASESRDNYLRCFFGFGKWLSRFDRRLLGGGLLKHRYERSRLAMQDYIECEAHRELLLTGLREGKGGDTHGE